MVETKEKSKVIRYVPDNDRIVTLLAAAGMLLIWFGVVDISVDTTVPSWLKGLFGPLANPENTGLSLKLGCVVLVLAAALWLFSLRRPVAFQISRSGISVHEMISTRMVPWTEILTLERKLGALVLHTSEARSGFLEKPMIVFKMGTLSMTSSEIEGLITYHRPDLLTSVGFQPKAPAPANDAGTAPQPARTA